MLTGARSTSLRQDSLSVQIWPQSVLQIASNRSIFDGSLARIFCYVYNVSAHANVALERTITGLFFMDFAARRTTYTY